MLVQILDFGSNWWSRFRRDSRDPFRFTRHAAYFNSTGLRCGRKIRRYWILPGLVRFNGVLNVLAYGHARQIRATFECADLTFAYGGNRLLILRQVPRLQTPDYYLILIRDERHGYIHFEGEHWKSAGTLPIAISHFKTRFEALILMKPGDWVRTELGMWQLLPAKSSCGVFLNLEQ